MTPAFRPPRVWSNRHVQTMAAALPLYAPPRGFRPHYATDVLIPLAGATGSLLARAWWQPGDAPRPAVMLLHGVGGNSESRYLVRAAVAYYEAGFHALRLNMRGVGGGVHHAESVYHAALTDDIDAAIAHVRSDPRVSAVHLAGFSSGGHVLLSLAAAWADSPPPAVKSVATISAPLDLAPCSINLERRRMLPYRWHIVRGLRRTALAHLAVTPRWLGLTPREVLAFMTLRDFDDRIVAPLHGFRDATHYYASASLARRVSRIHARTLLLHADDDPMIPPLAVRPFLSHAGPGVRVETLRRGGHVGFVERPRRSGLVPTWAVGRALAFAQEADDSPASLPPTYDPGSMES